MINNILFVLCALIFSSCGPKHKDLFTPQSEFPVVYKVTGENIKGRVFYMHYIQGNVDSLDEGYFGDLKLAMIQKGYQVVQTQTPVVSPDTFNDGGKSYLAAYLRYMNTVMRETNEKYGQASELIVGGISFGGIHTLMAAENLPFDRYFTIVGITDITTHPLFAGMHVPDFNAQTTKSKLLGKIGIMVWNDNDEVTNFRLTRSLQEYLKDTVEGVEFSGDGHGVYQKQIDAVINWL